MLKTPYSPRSVTYESRVSYFGSLEQYYGTNSKSIRMYVMGRVIVTHMTLWGVMSRNKMINFMLIFNESTEISNEISVVHLADCRIINQCTFCARNGENDKNKNAIKSFFRHV